MTARAPSFLSRLCLGLIRCYQRHISSRTPPVCRFMPSCSEYMAQAIRYNGALRGIWLGLKRIARCHPWSPGGYDPAPGAEPKNASSDDVEVHR